MATAMASDYWQQRWAVGRIGFHLAEPNPALVRHQHHLALKRGARVLVPLCGKSVDLEYLAAGGTNEVIGIELAEAAAKAFFDERKLVPAVTSVGPFSRYSAAGMAILV